MMNKHTPWRIAEREDYETLDNTCSVIEFKMGRESYGWVAEANSDTAAFIVRACNAHETLIEAIGALMGLLEEYHPCPDAMRQYRMGTEALATARGAGSEDD